MKLKQKTIYKAEKVLEDARTNPLLLALIQTYAAWIYLSFKVQWNLSKWIFGEDACSIARNKLNSDFNEKNNP